VTITLSGLVLGSASTNGLKFSGFLSTVADQIPIGINYGTIYGPLSSALVLLSQYLKNSQTKLILEFRGYSNAASVTSFVAGRLDGFSTSGSGLSGVTCFVNKNIPISVAGATLDSASSLLTIAITASSIGPNAVVRCSVGGLRTPAAASAARNDFSIWTLDSFGRKVDAIFGIRFPPIFDRLASRVSSNANPLRMTSADDPHLIRSTVLSSFLVSFTSSGAGSIKTITLQGLSDFTQSLAFSSSHTCRLDNVEYSAVTSYSDPFLSISVNSSGFSAASSADIVCSLRGLILPSSAVAAKDDLVISTFDVNGAALETMAGVSLPAIFASVATSVSLSLSSQISNDDRVILTLAFVSPNPPNANPKGSIKVISLSGVFFHSFAALEQAKCYHQNGLAVGVASLNSTSTEPLGPKILLVRLSGTDSISSSGVFITCTVSGFRNLPSHRLAGMTVGLSTWDELDLPLDTASLVAFPNIFTFAASNGTVALTSQVIQKSGVSMTLRFKVPFTNQPITSITLSGLQFSAPLQTEQPSAQCFVDNSAPMESESTVSSLLGALAELKMLFQAPGLPVGSGSYGLRMLDVTCRITKLVNAPSASVATSSVSVAIFGNSLPLYFQRGIVFPALFGQSLGFKRPRVSYDLFCFVYVFLTFLFSR
jgi:hypothetical protein